MLPPAITLLTPPIARRVPDGVFDAFGWCESDVLAWRRPAFDAAGELDPGNPARMVFVMHAPCPFLPRELARLHAFGLGLGDDDFCLAPYAIDDATDELWARRVRPRDVFWLAADNLNALVWGLHDWAHFHNHGPFVERAWTELQCDAAALVWLALNRDAIGVDRAAWGRVHAQIVALGARRFAEEGQSFDPAWLDADGLQREADAMRTIGS